MPQISLDTVSTDTLTGWSVYGTSDPAYLAVRRGSGDSTGITTSAGSISKFVVSTGYSPRINFVSNLTLWCRCRKTDPLSVGGTLALRIYNDLNGLPFAFSTKTLSSSWTWVSISAYINLTNDRFSFNDLYKLKAHVATGVLPSSGAVEVSEIYLQEDFVEGYLGWYDACCGVLPSAVTGALNWISSGTQAALVTKPYLRINDGSVVNNRDFSYAVPSTMTSDYNTSLETSFYIAAVPVTFGTFYTVFAYQDSSSSVELVVFRKTDGTIHLCLTEASRDHEDFTDCLASYELTDFTTTRAYKVSAVVDRNTDPHNMGKVRVFLDYSTTPVLDVYYAEFVSAAYAPKVFFGTRNLHTCDARIEYVACQSSRRSGTAFRAWDQFEGTGSFVTIDSSDSQICKFHALAPLPDVVAGQSNNACRLDCSGTAPCGVRQITKILADSVAYTLDIEYRDSTAAASPLRVTVQRSTDLFYWDEGTASWVSPATYVDLPHSATRTQVNVSTQITPDNFYSLVITLEYNFTAPPAPSWIWMYRIYLAET